MDLDEEMRLVARLLSGDARALEQFVETYRRFITSVLSRQPNLYSQEIFRALPQPVQRQCC